MQSLSKTASRPVQPALRPLHTHRFTAMAALRSAATQPLRVGCSRPLHHHALTATAPQLARHLTTLYSQKHNTHLASTLRSTPTTYTSTLSKRHASSIPSTAMDGAVAADIAKQWIDKVAGASEAQLYHGSSIAVAAAFPAGLLLSPTFLALPFDIILTFALPLHSHIGLVQIIEDYVPRPYQNYSKAGLIVVTVLTTLGLMKITLCGAGISESFKSLWRRPPTTGLRPAPPVAAPSTAKSSVRQLNA